MQTMTRTCTNPAPFHNAFVNGAECTADGSSATSSQNCNTHACPVDGTWSGWTYGTCSTSCGAGTKSGTRTCQGQAHGGADCAGSATGSFACDHGPCPVHCATSAFSGWSTCTKSCGTGTQSRTRTCDGQNYGGKGCVGSTTDTRDCNTHACPINGGWS